ncbi:TPA: endonuclease/exonuclease/phosphatase family protein [Serratia liquefaciens]|nr:endonuclease/exonuclease/phosphatase family protein [Serratia liquefaciens]HEJ7992727.1 endonuclease/exonuclease/phosphatase family protein [Serratia liquefaciens]
MTLNLAWWNIGVSPPILTNKKDKTKELHQAGEFIKKFSVDKSIDFLAICEICETDSIYLKSIADELYFGFIDLSGRDGRIVIDMALMYETSKLEYISHKNITSSMPDRTRLRTGIKIIFKEVKTNDYITFFLSHWPSKLSLDESDRDKFAHDLRTYIDNVFDKYGEESKIILMGDYNTQPYSKSLHNTLYSTKDFHLIQKKKKLLFNPFWRLISDGNHNNIGTYYYGSSKLDRWYVFDQMLFSSSFLSGKPNQLRLDLTSFECHSIFDKHGKNIDTNFLSSFDHFPIFGRLYYEK